MKKVFAFLLTIMMMLTMTMTTTAFASETVTSDGGTASIGVKAKYVDGTSTNSTISVNVSWGAMEFTYSTGGTQTWNPTTHQYTGNTTAGWSETGNTVTVTNHSDSAVKVAFGFQAETGYGVTGSFSNDSINLPSAVGKATTASELTGTSTLTLDGTLSNTVTTSTKVGTITVTITTN